MITISLNQILSANPSHLGWVNILYGRGKLSDAEWRKFSSEPYEGLSDEISDRSDDVQFPLSMALESNSAADVIWAFCVLPEYNSLWAKFAVWCARHVVSHAARRADSTSLSQLLDTAWKHADGLATDEDLSQALSYVFVQNWSLANWIAVQTVNKLLARNAASAARLTAGWATSVASVALVAGSNEQAAKLKQILDAGCWVEDALAEATQ